MKGQILAVDFDNKKLLKNTQQKSDKKPTNIISITRKFVMGM